jgi:hypothetical protein
LWSWHRPYEQRLRATIYYAIKSLIYLPSRKLLGKTLRPVLSYKAWPLAWNI